MNPVTTEQLHEAIQRFHLDGEFSGVRALPRGHIHDTFVSAWLIDGARRQFIHQRMNHTVFPDIDMLMDNIHKVSDHMLERVGENGADGFEILRLVKTRNGNPFARTGSGAWRTYVYIENTRSYDLCQSTEQAYQAARAFGWFQAQLQDLPASQLGETLEDFFDSPTRFRQFERALATSNDVRRKLGADAIRFAQERRDMVGVIAKLLAGGELPARIVHGDTKLNNILFDVDTGRPKGIVDLDTCMAGYSLYDFGDLVRFTAAKSAEDETDLERVGTDLERYKALAEGYLSTAGEFLTDREVELMPFAARLVTLTIGLRFLTDFLDGDVYFKIDHANHNLDRARVQFGMVADMERQAEQMTISALRNRR